MFNCVYDDLTKLVNYNIYTHIILFDTQVCFFLINTNYLIFVCTEIRLIIQKKSNNLFNNLLSLNCM